jgi:hypothetical protein
MMPLQCENKAMDIHSLGGMETNRRRQPRSIFIYPVAFELFSNRQEPAFYNGIGYLKDITLGGAGLQFEDKYGRFVIDEQENGRSRYKDKYGRFEFSEEENISIKFSLNLSREEKAVLFGSVCWLKKIENSFQARMGIAFSNLEPGVSAAVEKLIGFKNKDLHTLWTLWEQYQNHNLMWNLWE